MKKREREEPSSEDEEYAARDQFVRDNGTSMRFEELVEKFLEEFKLKNRSSAFDSLRKTFIRGGFSDMVDRLHSSEFKTWWKDNHVRLTSIPKLLEKETRKVQVRAIMSGSSLLQTGISAMSNPFLLHPGGVSPERSSGDDSSGGRSPSVSYQGRKCKRGKEVRVYDQEAKSFSSSAQRSESVDATVHFAKLGQAVEWHVGGVDMIAEFRSFKKQDSTNLFSLSVDDIADVRSGSGFAKTLDENVGRSARVVKPAPDIFQRWPTLSGVCQRVFQWEDYDKIFEAVCKENMEDPIARYLLTTVMAYSHYFEFRDEIPDDINEGEGFGITASFIRTALTLCKIESRYQEVLMTGVEERRNLNRDPRLESKEAGRYADGVALYNNHQILLSEAALIRRPKPEKRFEDEYKVLRAMRDSWMSQVRSICAESKPLQGIAVFGTASFMSETRLFRMDYQGVFRVQQFDAFFIPLKKKEFGSKMKEAILSCLRLGARLDQEITYRRQSKTSVPFEERDEMVNAMRCILGTTATPTKVPKTPKKKNL